MRTLGVAIVTVALLAGTAPGVLAQEEEEAPTSSLVTGRVLRDTSPQDDWQEVWVDGNVVHVLGWRVERVVDWSDPRLPTSMLSRGNVDTHLAESGLVQTYAETYRLDGPKGAWTGTGRALAMEHGSDPVWLMVLHGEGVYDGLSAMLVRETVRADPGSGDLDHTVMKGSILEGGLPAMPDPIEPSAE